MKIHLPKDYDSGKPKPVLPLIDDEGDVPTSKENIRTFDLYSNPADNTSAKYKSAIRVLQGTESLRTTIKWRKDAERILTGLALANAVNKVQILKELLRGTSLTQFETAIDSHARMNREATAIVAEETSAANGDDDAAQAAAGLAVRQSALSTHYDNNSILAGYDAVVHHVAPSKVLTKIKRDLRRHTRKPRDMKVREFLIRLLHINREEIPYLPTYDGRAPTPLQDDEVIDIIINAVPKSWMREMDRQGNDPDVMSPGAFVKALENIETAEENLPDDNAAKGNGKSKKLAKTGNGGGQKYCALHGKGSHTTDECKSMQAQVKKMKSSNYKSDGNKKPYGNKTWTKKAEDSKYKSKKELNAMTKKLKKLTKEVNSLTADKKRKADDSSSDEAELHAIEQELNALDMNGFDIDDLKQSLKASGEIDDEMSV